MTGRTPASAAVFGAFDGAVSVVGALAGLLAAHTSGRAILAVCAGLAVAAAVGMGAGDWLSGSPARTALVMALATLAGSLIPVLPVLLLPEPAGVGGAIIVLAALGVWISETRADDRGRVRAYTGTAALLITAAVLSVAVAVGLGGVG